MKQFERRSVVVAVLIVGAALVFMPGIPGNFQLDDIENLAPVQRMLAGDVTWDYVVDTNRSGALGRPVAMASFVASALASGYEAAPFRVINLFLHALSGLVVWRLARWILLRDPSLRGHAEMVAAMVALTWMLLPIHVSTVLYVVQRMTILSALFTGIALLAYMAARERALTAQRQALALLYLAFPAATALAMLSKENGALAPVYALAIECGCFGILGWRATTRPRIVAQFFLLFLALPALAALCAIALKPELVTAGYEGRAFDLGERVLTQARVLWSYVGNILLPVGADLGLMQDDTQISRSLLQPATTVLAILAWIAVTGLALVLCGRRPAIAAGVLIFLAGHAMESSILPLEIRFDHRNYLPAFGVLLAAAGVATWILQRVAPTPTPRFTRLAPMLLIALVAAYASATLARSRVWSSPEATLQQLQASKADSPRLQALQAVWAMDAGNLALALTHIDRLDVLAPHDPLATAALRVLAYCKVNKQPPPLLIERLGELPTRFVGLQAMTALGRLATASEAGDCPQVPRARLLPAIARLLEQPGLDPNAHGTWRVRYHLARLQAAEQDWDAAIQTAERSWADSDWNQGIGVLVFQLHASNGDRDGARKVLERLRAAADPRDLALARALQEFQRFVDT